MHPSRPPTPRDLIVHFTLTSRPYSYADNLARGVVACALVGRGNDPASLLIASAVSLLMWLFLNWSSDWRQEDEGRLKAPLLLIWTPLVITAIICGLVRPQSLVFLWAYGATIAAYPFKVKRALFGPLGPVFRGLMVVAHFLLIVACLDDVRSITLQGWLIVVGLGILHIAKNLVGDIRDIEKDTHEIPAQFGFATALWVVRGIFAVVLTISVFIDGGFVTIGLPLLFQWVLIEGLTYHYGQKHARWIGYVGHRTFIFTFTLSEVFIARYFEVNGYVWGALTLLLIVLFPAYRFVPGKKYQEWTAPKLN